MREAVEPERLSAGLTMLFAVACGTFVANLYYAQALVSVIGPALGLRGGFAGLTVTVTQLGYAAGLLFVVSLADLIENRRLILCCVAAMTLGLAAAAVSTSAAAFVAASIVVGIGSVAAQIIVPLAAHLTHETYRGRTIGNVMGGLITGIMLARPLANFIASAFGWRAVFGASAVAGASLGIVLWFALPVRRPAAIADVSRKRAYEHVLASMWQLFVRHGLLRRRAATQAAVFACFNLFWTAVPLALGGTFGFDRRGIALFALAGAGGALAAPLAGRLADRGYSRAASLAALATVATSFVLGGAAVAYRLAALLVFAAIALDAATQTNQIVNQRTIYGIDSAARGRINAVYMTCIFLAGATGSFVATIAYAAGGWTWTSAIGAICGAAALAFAAGETPPATPATADIERS